MNSRSVDGSRVALYFAICAALVFAVFVPGTAQAGSKLWLYPDSEDPRNGGHVVENGVFQLNIENLGSGNGDTTAYEVFLVLSVNDPALMAGGSLGFPDGTTVDLDPAAFAFQTPVFPCSGHSFPPHGVYPSYIAEFYVGDLADGQVVQIAVEIQGEDNLVAHFDSFGTGYKQTGNTVKCYDISNPAGHDVSVVFAEEYEACPRFVIDKVASASGVDFGDQVDFTITLDNPSDCDATNVLVSDHIPFVTTEDGSEVPAFDIVAVEPSPTQQTDEIVIWEIGDLLAGESLVFTLTTVFDEIAADGSVVENTACVDSEESEDINCSSAAVEIGEVGDNEIGGPGFWCNQIRFAADGRHNAKFSIEELEQWLTAINEISPVFSELWDTAVLDGAMTLLCRPNLAQTVADRLARQLLALRFNAAAERVDPELSLGDLCEGSEPLPDDLDLTITIAEVIDAAESEILVGAGDEVLSYWLEVIDFINNASVRGCSEARQAIKAIS